MTNELHRNACMRTFRQVYVKTLQFSERRDQNRKIPDQSDWANGENRTFRSETMQILQKTPISMRLDQEHNDYLKIKSNTNLWVNAKIGVFCKNVDDLRWLSPVRVSNMKEWEWRIDFSVRCSFFLTYKLSCTLSANRLTSPSIPNSILFIVWMSCLPKCRLFLNTDELDGAPHMHRRKINENWLHT